MHGQRPGSLRLVKAREHLARLVQNQRAYQYTYRKYHLFGEPQPWWKKVFLEGGGLFTIIFSLLVVPFFVFSTSNLQVDINPVCLT